MYCGQRFITYFLCLITFRTFLQRVNLVNYLHGEGDLEDFMEMLFKSYSNWINEYSDDLASWLSTQRSLQEAISEVRIIVCFCFKLAFCDFICVYLHPQGLAFLGKLHTLMDKKHWTSKELAHKFQQWLKLLIQLVDMKSPEAAQCLKLFLDHRHCICKEHKKMINMHVSCIY